MSGVRGLLGALRLKFMNEYSIAEEFRRQGAHIGEGCRILVRTLGSEPYLVSIGDETLVSSGVTFITHDGATWVIRDRYPDVNRFGRIDIGRRCFIGAGSTILPGTRIGQRCVVGAGSVVKGRFEDGSIIAGVPARTIGTVDEWTERVLEESFSLVPGTRDEMREQLERLLPYREEE